MSVRANRELGVWMNALTDGRTNGWSDRCMDAGWMDGAGGRGGADGGIDGWNEQDNRVFLLSVLCNVRSK